MITLFCIAGFSYYFVILSIRYSEYETLTEVTLMDENDFKSFQDSLCISLSAILSVQNRTSNSSHVLDSSHLFTITFKKEQFIQKLTKNEAVVKLGTEYTWNNLTKCWLLESNVSQKTDDEYYQLYSFLDLSLKSWIMRFIPGRSFDDIPNQRYPMERSTWKRVIDFNVLNSLEPPYDTNCFHYDECNMTSQARCVVSCQFPSSKIDDELEESLLMKCQEKCSRQDCVKLVFDDHFRSSPISSSIGIYFSNRYNLNLQSLPRFTSVTFMLQTVGLVAMFFEVSIISLVFPTKKMIKKCHQKVMKFFRLKNKVRPMNKIEMNKRKLYWRRFKKFLFLFVFVGFVAHVSITTSSYFRFDVISETFIGTPIQMYSPSLSVCFLNPHKESSPQQVAKLIQPYQLFEAVPGRNFRVSLFFWNHEICFRFRYHEPSRETLGWIKLKFNAEKEFEYTFYLSSHHSFPRSTRPFQASTHRHDLFFSRVIEYSSLPAPFKSDCFDYNQIGFHSQAHCIDECIINNFTSNFGLFPNSMINYHHWNMTSSLKEPSMEVINFCGDQFNKRDCFLQQFSLTDRSSKSFVPGSIYVKAPSESVAIQLLPRFGLVDFVTYTATTFGFWLGISCILVVLKTFKFFSLISIFSRRKKTGKVLIWFILLAGLSFHIYQLIDAYLRYTIVSTISMGSPTSLNLPSLSLVFGLNIKTSKNHSTFQSYLLSSPKEFNENFMRKSDMIEEVELVEPDSLKWVSLKGEDLSQVFLNTHEYIVQRAKVVTIDLNSIQPIKYNPHKLQVKDSFIRLVFKHDLSIRNVRSLFHLILHSGKYYEIQIDEPEFDPAQSTLCYDLTVTKLLPAPYPSDCINYADPIEDNHTWFKCIINSYPNKTLPFYLTLPASFTTSRTLVDDSNIRKKCIQKFKSKPDCEFTYYKSEFTDRLQIYDKWDIVVDVPDEEIDCRFIPKTTLLDLMIFLVDALGIWIGINVYSLLKKLISPSE